MEVECVAVEDERRLAELRFDAAVKVIKSLPPNGECPGPTSLAGPAWRFQIIHLTCMLRHVFRPAFQINRNKLLITTYCKYNGKKGTHALRSPQ